MLNWKQIQTVFLDMDGTLLDLHFDNYFWQEHVPKRFARQQGISDAHAKAQLQTLYQTVEGTIDWYCVDYWTQTLGLDIALLKQEVEHLIQVHPHVTDFLAALRRHQKRVVMVTNAHAMSLTLKMEKTQLAGHFDRLISAHTLGLPKEQRVFWRKLQAIEPFDLAHTLLVDDSISVLQSAQDYGIEHIVAVSKPDSKQGVNVVDGFLSIESFDQLLDDLR